MNLRFDQAGVDDLQVRETISAMDGLSLNATDVPFACALLRSAAKISENKCAAVCPEFSGRPFFV